MAQSIVSTGTTGTWSIYEQLCLTSILKRTGCGNWEVVSNLMNILNVGQNEKFTSQKCAIEFGSLSDAASAQKRKRGEDLEHQLLDEIHKKVVAERITELEKLAEEDRRVLRQMRKKYESFLSTADANTIEAEYNLICDVQEQEGGSESDSDAFDSRQQTPRRRTPARSSAVSSNTSQDETDKEESGPSTPVAASRDSESVVPTPESPPATSGSPQKKTRQQQQQQGAQASKPAVGPRRQPGLPRPASTSDTDSFISETASPAPTPSSSAEKDRDYYRWKKAILLLWRTISNHRNANLFMHAVREDIAPGYSLAIKRPMTLMMMKKAIESGAIRTTEEFIRDLLLMFQNALMYNNSDTEVYRMATDMRSFAVTHVKEFQSTLDPPEQNILREKGDGAEKEEERRSLRRSTAESSDSKPKRRT